MATTIDRSQSSAGAPEPQRDMRGGRERPIGGVELWAWRFMRISGLVLPGSTKILIDNVIGQKRTDVLLPLVGGVLLATLI